MDTRCIKGLPIKLTILKNLEKFDGKSWNLESLEIKLKIGQMPQSWEIVEKLETNIPAFESV